MAESTTLLLFGATGDLARSKLEPALHDLAASGRLPGRTSVLGISRSADTDALRALADADGRQGRRKPTPAWERLVAGIAAVNGAGDDPALYDKLERALDQRPGSRLSYLSVAPALFGAIAARLAGIGLGRAAGRRSRIVIEKPFGSNLASARALREQLHAHFDEEQLLRIDHYLGKETVQNLATWTSASTPARAADRDAPEAYERLLGEALAGDRTRFATSTEVEAQWAAVEPLLRARPDPVPYAPGSEGPGAADELIERAGRRWRPVGAHGV